MKEGRVTIRDIAKEANVSHTAVSHILSHKSEKLRISESTRKRVEEIARKMNYRPNYAGRGLVCRKTLLIGLFTPFGNFNLMPRILRGVQKECTKHDYAILHFSFTNQEDEKQCIRNCLYRGVDGIIAAPFFENPDQNNTALYQSARDSGIPIVEVCGNFIENTPSVNTDAEKGCLLSIEHLRSLGHRKIALFTHDRYQPSPGRYAHPDAEHQYYCCRNITERFGMELEVISHFLPDHSSKNIPFFAEQFYASAVETIEQWLKKTDRAKAVICYNEFQALAALNTANRNHVRIPEELAVISFDSLDISDYSQPALTAVRQNFDEIGAEAARRLFDWMDSGTPGICDVLIPPQIMIRNSTLKQEV